METILGHKPANRVAFGSNVARKMFPLHTAPDRLGIEMGLRGEPHRGPATYQPHPVDLFLQPMDVRPRSRKGWFFGGRTSSRSPAWRNSDSIPGPCSYQNIKLASLSQNSKPFGKICPRFLSKEYQTIAPGPGRYEHNVETNRQIEFHHAFGGKKKLKETVKIKCTNGLLEKCQRCNVDQIGDYYESQEGNEFLCQSCFQTLSINSPMREKKIRCFGKVRNCSSIHNHEFPGFAPKIIIRSEKETQRLKQKEAYFRLHYSD